MKHAEFLVLGLAGLALYMIVRAGQGGAAKPSTAASGPREILDRGKPYENGWRYFSNGTAISPEGVYYYGGAEVYRP